MNVTRFAECRRVTFEEVLAGASITDVIDDVMDGLTTAVTQHIEALRPVVVSHDDARAETYYEAHIIVATVQDFRAALDAETQRLRENIAALQPNKRGFVRWADIRGLIDPGPYLAAERQPMSAKNPTPTTTQEEA